MGVSNRRFKDLHKRTLKHTNIRVLKKLAIAFAIALLAAGMYIYFLSPHTLEAKQRTQLESTQKLLIEARAELEKKTGQSAEDVKKIEELNKSLQETQAQLQAKRESSTVHAATSVHGSEAVAYHFFVSQGFTKAQAAGILGNLRQEHNYSTSDVPGGLGIAQWLGARRDRLIAKGNHLDFSTQLQFIVEELNTTESKAMKALKAANSVEAATIAFQNLYERCGDCRQSQRIAYAKDVFSRY